MFKRIVTLLYCSEEESHCIIQKNSYFIVLFGRIVTLYYSEE